MQARTGHSPVIYLMIFLGAALGFFSPLLGNYFVSDDFLVLNRLALDHSFWPREFFRPLSDLSIWLTYQLFGFRPFPYILFNILVHGLNAYLVFTLARKFPLGQGNRVQSLFAWLAALFFLVYPFHTEAIAWLLGRGASMAVFFALAGILILLNESRQSRSLPLVSTCYLLGLTSYESIIFYPLIIIVWLRLRNYSLRQCAYWGLALGLTFLVNIGLRIYFSGSLMGQYGSQFLQQDLIQYLTNPLKTLGRLILPPAKHPILLVGLFLAAGLLFYYLLSLFFKKNPVPGEGRRQLKALAYSLAFASLIPLLFGVSTRSSETDRFLYFPSVFLCMMIAFLLVSQVQDLRKLALVALAICCYEFMFLENNIFHWVRASSNVKSFISSIKAAPPTDTLYVVNMPEEWKGAFIFRLGFNEAMRINQIDTGRIRLVNRLGREEIESISDSIVLVRNAQGLFIPPSVFIGPAADSNASWRKGIIQIDPGKNSRIIYWNISGVRTWP